MLNPIIYKFQYGKNTVTLETGMIANQATSAVMASMDDTTVLVTVVGIKKVKFGQSFFPLTVNYQERTYAAGRFPGGFFRREGRPNENEMLISRLIDRPIRPLFPKNFFHEVQVIATVVSVNPEINPDIIAMIGVSAALSLSGIPFNGPVGIARVGYIKGKYILNPTRSELVESNLDLMISGTANAILMVESESQLLGEELILDAMIYGHNQQQIVIDNINNMTAKFGKSKWNWQPEKINYILKERITELSKFRLDEAYSIVDTRKRHDMIDIIKDDILNILKNQDENLNEHEIKDFLTILEKKILRQRILNGESRVDGRQKDMVRKINARVGILPRTHGSALFTRGETQALVTTTLGSERDAQNIDELTKERIDRFLVHYNFLPYCTGETGVIGSPKRREIGHGRLVKRGIMAVMPNAIEFPYTVRVVSEVTESNGSSSMASICGASLALMDAGVPIKSAIAGIAMGLVKENDNFVILSDIIGDEDHLGDMDFKIAGNREGITALQMDIKIEGITNDIIKLTLNQAKSALIYILELMEKAIVAPRNDISPFAPRIYTLKINIEKIKDLIGKGGSVIRALTEETGVIIEIKDDGIVKITSTDNSKACHAISRIKDITSEIEVGRVYNGRVSRIVDFGAFVTIKNFKEGLVHISQISDKRVEKVTDHLELGQKILVRVIEVDRQGRIRLSIKGVSHTFK